MSTRINTNIEALNAQRNLNVTATKYASSVEKLSSGLRINRAADDAAGLAISEKLQSQVTGLNQAQRNAQDGVSMVQTAEGALTEVHSMLQRIRELAVEAANSTIGASDAQSVNAEITALQAEITRIGNTTKFNGQNLLDGSLGVGATASGLSAITGALPQGVTTPIRAGSLAAGAYTLTAATSASPGTTSTIGGSNALGTSKNPGGFSAATAIDDQANGLLTQTGSANSVGSLSALGGGLGGVTTFAAGTLAADNYMLSVTNPGHASVLGGNINTTATVNGSTAIDDIVNGLWTTTAGGSSLFGDFGQLTVARFNNAGIGTGGALTNTASNVPGTLTESFWQLNANSGGANVGAATFELDDLVNNRHVALTNVGGVLTDAVSGFHLDLSGITGAVGPGSATDIHLSQDRGVDTVTNSLLRVYDAAMTETDLTLTKGETFQQVADAINTAAGSGGAQVVASVGANGLVITNAGASANSATNIGVFATLNTLRGLGLDAPGVVSTSGWNNSADGVSWLTGVGGAADAVSATLTGASSHTTYALTNSGNVWSNAASGFSINLSGVTGGTLTAGLALLRVGGGVGPSITLTDETGTSQAVALTGGETFQQVIDAINATGLALQASFASGGIKLTSTGSNLGGAITVRGSDDALRGLGFEAAYGSAASTSNTVTATGTLGAAASGSGGPTTITLTGSGAPVALTDNAGVYSDSASGFSIDFSGVTGSLSAGTATITVTGSGALFQIGANEGDTMGASFANARTAAFTGFDAAITAFGSGPGTATAGALITATDAAISQVSTIRAGYGAVENRLNHTVAAISVASENLNQSMSRIRDLDMASEMVNFTKNQILQQAGTSILAQANSAPQSILALLR